LGCGGFWDVEAHFRMWRHTLQDVEAHKDVKAHMMTYVLVSGCRIYGALLFSAIVGPFHHVEMSHARMCKHEHTYMGMLPPYHSYNVLVYM
jgi:hypothetical protein